MTEINRVDAAATMFGTGSKQHLAAIKKFGPGGGAKSQHIKSDTKKAGSKKVAGVKSGGNQPRDSIGRFK